jgi:undecaprenyl-diphosphatase
MTPDPTPPLARRRLPLPLLAAVALTAGFGWLALEVARGGGVTRFDEELAKRLHESALASPGLAAVFTGITELGSRRFLVGFSAAVAVILALARLWRLALLWGGAQVFCALVMAGVKAVRERPRPHWEVPVITEEGWSFPSGHSAGSALAYGLLAYLIALRWTKPAARAGSIAGLALLVLLIGFSRMYLGVHYFSDVCGGFCLGLITLCLCIALIEWARRRLPAVDRPDPPAGPRPTPKTG